MPNNTTKRFHVLILMLAFALVLAACGQTAAESGQASPAGSFAVTSDAPENTPSAQSGREIRLLTDVQGFRDAAGPAGYYEIVQVAEGGNNIVYTDYTTASRIFLCARPECIHTDESCTSWVPFSSQSGTVMDSANGGRVFYIGGGMVPGNSEAFGVYVMEPNGENRKELCLLANGQFVEGAVAFDGQTLYFKRVTVGEAGAEAVCEIIKLDFDTGALSSVAALENSGAWLAGAFDDKLVLEDYRDTHVIYKTLSPSTGEEQEVYSYDYSGGNISARVLGDKLVLMQKSGEATGDMVSVSLRDGSETTIQTGLPMISADTTYADGCFGSLMVWQMGAVNNNTKACYALDVESGRLSEITLTTERYGVKEPLWVFADAGDNLLVVTSDEESGTRTIIDNAGNPYTVPITTMSRALISKADYLANRPNFTPITDTVPA